MPAFADFVRRLLEEGSALLRQRPEVSDDERSRVRDLLASEFARHRLDVAGPAVPFDPGAAVAAAERAWWACWFLVARGEAPAEVEKVLTLPAAPATPAEHLSADLVLRFLPVVHRRAKALDPGDVLTRWLTALLRQWPLSGVLSDVGEGPTTPADFGGHPGLQLLYAERLAEHVRPEWIPEGEGREVVEVVFAERGLPVPAAEVKAEP
jgi:hypothetical protein